MLRRFRVGLLLLSLGLAVPAEARVTAHSAREFFGDAAFGLPQHYVLAAVIGLVVALVVVAALSRRNTPLEAAFLIAVGGGLVSNPAGMILITLGSLFSALAIGQVLTSMGIESPLTPDQQARVARALQRRGPHEVDGGPP
jgi:hypothetical protein